MTIPALHGDDDLHADRHPGAQTRTAQITVITDAPPIINSFALADDTLAPGLPMTLLWDTSATITAAIADDDGNAGNDIGSVALDANGDGSITLPAPAATTTYTLTATNPVDSVTATATITVGPPPVISQFTAADENILPRGAADLTWDVSDATSVQISPALGSVALSGNGCDFPEATTTYTLTATNDFGSSTAQVTVNVPLPLGVDENLWTITQTNSTLAGALDTLAEADQVANSNPGDAVFSSRATATNVPVVNLGPGASGVFPGDSAPPIGDGFDDFVGVATATLRVNFPGTYTFGINNDDGGRLRIDGITVINDDTLHGPTTFTESVSLTAGLHTIEYLYFERGGGQSGEVLWDPGTGLQLLGATPPAPAIVTADAAISEFGAANQETVEDAEGDSSDWVEIYNGTAAAIDLAGYYLTDDAAIPDKWAFPSYALQPGEYLVVFASGKAATFGANEFHTNFQLSAAGEYLALTKGDGAGGFTAVTEFAPAFPEQFDDISYGYYDSEGYLGYFVEPTPGAINIAGVDGFVGDTSFSADRGFYTDPVAVELAVSGGTTGGAGVTIRYTTDGSTPTLNHGAIYGGTPLTIAETTVLRAAGFRKGYQPTNVDTQTYVFLADVLTQDKDHAVALGFPPTQAGSQKYDYGMDPVVVNADPAAVTAALQAIPSLSLAIDQDDFSDAATGIYSNAGNRGLEARGSVELLDNGAGDGDFQIDCGVRIRGGFSRSGDNPKHAFRLFFNNRYDGALRYPLFQDEGADRFEKMDLRTSQNYSWSFGNDTQNTFLREVWARDSQRAMGQPYTRSRYYHLYINGHYWGLYMSQERSEADYGATYFGGDEDDYDTIKSAGSAGGYNTEATDGDLNGDWQTLWNRIRALRTMSDPAAIRAEYFALQGLAPDGVSPHPDPANNPVLLDADNLIDYMLGLFYAGGFDTALSTFLSNASNNWFCVRNRVADDRGFQFFLHDCEHGMGTDKSSGTGLTNNLPNNQRSTDRTGPWGGSGNNWKGHTMYGTIGDFAKSNPQYLHEDLAHAVPEYRVRFADRVQRHFFNAGALTDQAARDRVEARAATVSQVILAESARWGDSLNRTRRTPADWQNAKNALLDFINFGSNQDGSGGPGRSAKIVSQLQAYRDEAGVSKPLYPLGLNAPVYSQLGGQVPAGYSLTLTNPNAGGTIYYTADGSDPREAGGAIRAGAVAYAGAITLNDSGAVLARVRDGSGNWSALQEATFIVGTPAAAGMLVVSELHYHPADPTQAEIDAGFADPDLFEFIEILNLSGAPVATTLRPLFQRHRLRLPADAAPLAAGERLVLVSNLAAFAERYPGVVPAGQYTGNLRNSGEGITLLAADASIIQDFNYSDGGEWPAAADGGGPSLVFRHRSAAPADGSVPANWFAHGTGGGNPGGPDDEGFADFAAARGLSGIPTDDDDKDHLSDFAEFALGTDPKIANPTPASVEVQAVDPDDGSGIADYLIITFTRRLSALGDAAISPQFSTELTGWADLTDAELIGRTNNGDGTESLTYRAPNPLGADPRRGFLRLAIRDLRGE
ncbi:MAG: chitobiase/beta-hexosaminidase C-terminal domain-containing protein [Verrucomicrobiales bacterium]